MTRALLKDVFAELEEGLGSHRRRRLEERSLRCTVSRRHLLIDSA
jgi:hypothetical protein